MTESELSKTPRILQLDDQTIGHIAAGEVIERPAQVVKELIENSMDAGSTRIMVKIERGGFDNIEVIDNGKGIHSDDLPLAIKRHATSKLNSASDLNKIKTLGFRGEAVASIGMVSNLKVSSRPLGKNGMSISMKEGHKGKLESLGMPEGTKIEVRDLFQNVPARLSFQKSPSTENSAILDIISKYSIARPDISFQLEIDDKLVLDAQRVDEHEERLFDILGTSSNKLITLNSPPADDDAPGDEKWNGWISPPQITRGKGDEIYVFVNGRPVANQPFRKAIRKGYHTRLMVGRHPLAVIFLQLPEDEVDVNIHPTKREVRLKNSWRVLERLERSIQHSLQMVPTEITPDENFPLKSISQQMELEIDPREDDRPNWVKASDNFLEEPQEKITISKSPMSQTTLPGLEKKPISNALSKEERKLDRYIKTGKPESPLNEDKFETLDSIEEFLPEIEPLCQFADTYILAQCEDELFMIDQHALHERIRYERLKNTMTNWDKTPLLIPKEIELNKLQILTLNENKEILNSVGLEFDNSDSKILLTSVPHLLSGSDSLYEFIYDILQDIKSDNELESVNKLRERISLLQSCRGSIKANHKLNLAEMRRLLDDMRKIPNPFACIHGRPTVLKISLNELDKHFGRMG